MEWFYLHDARRVGPVTEDHISQLLADGVIDDKIQVWNHNLPAWQPLSSSSIAHLATKDGTTAPPPVPGSAVGSGLVWILAFCPILGGVITILLSPLVDTAGALFWVSPALNLIFVYADDRRLRCAGYSTEKLGAAWLIPVYLWRRAVMLRQSKAYFWVWCIAMILALLFL